MLFPVRAAAGAIAPDLFIHIIPWEQFEPVGVATVIGAFGGVLCGGGLGVFAVFIELLANWINARRTART